MTEHDAIVVSAPWFEDFHVGLQFDAPAVTLTEGHAALYQALFGDRLRLPLDRHASARITGTDAPLAHPLLAINVAIGQSTWASQRVKANLFYRGLRLQRPVYLGDTLYTRTRVVALRQNRPQEGRAATGIVALEMTTTNQHGETVLHFWRCPMIPCRDPAARTGHADDLDAVGHAVDREALQAAVPRHWNLRDTAAWSGRFARDCAPPQRFEIEARDTVTLAPELVRVSLNMAMAHTDARASYLGERLVYGGHTIFMAFAQVTRALPNLLGIVAWESCDHTGPVLENDRLRTRFELTEAIVLPAEQGGHLLRIEAECFAARGAVATESESETRVLEWKFWVWSA
ncbi:MAG: MaoC/PaaZ C-terminal domain-containing protein [Nevskiaceae bacterium]